MCFGKVSEDNQIAIRWSHDQKTRRPTTKSSIQSQTQCFHQSEKSKKTDGVNSDSLDALCSRQADMGRSSSTGLNQVLVVVPY
jgi:hypothetical protein